MDCTGHREAPAVGSLEMPGRARNADVCLSTGAWVPFSEFAAFATQHEAGVAVYVNCLCPLASLQGLPCWLVQGKHCVVALSSREN